MYALNLVSSSYAVLSTLRWYCLYKTLDRTVYACYLIRLKKIDNSYNEVKRIFCLSFVSYFPTYKQHGLWGCDVSSTRDKQRISSYILKHSWCGIAGPTGRFEIEKRKTHESNFYLGIRCQRGSIFNKSLNVVDSY